MDTYVSLDEDYNRFRKVLIGYKCDINIVFYSEKLLREEILEGFDIISSDPHLPYDWCKKVYEFYLNNLYHYAIISLYTNNIGYQSLNRLRMNEGDEWDYKFINELNKCLKDIPRPQFNLGVIKGGRKNITTEVKYPTSVSFRTIFGIEYMKDENYCLYRVLIPGNSNVAFHCSIRVFRN